MCCLLVLNLVSSTLSCIRQPRPRLVVVALPHARTIVEHDPIGAEVTLFRPTIPDGHTAQLSRTKTFLVTSTASFCSSASNFVVFSRAAHSPVFSSLRPNLPSMTLNKLPGWKCMLMIATRLNTSSIADFKIFGPHSLIPCKCSTPTSPLRRYVPRRRLVWTPRLRLIGTPLILSSLYSAAERHMPPALDDSEEASASDMQSEDSDSADD